MSSAEIEELRLEIELLKKEQELIKKENDKKLLEELEEQKQLFFDSIFNICDCPHCKGGKPKPKFARRHKKSTTS